MKIKWIILTGIVIILAAAWMYLHFRKSRDFEPQIKEKLAGLVATASNGLYKLDMEHIDIDITNGTVVANNIFLLPDSLQMAVLEKSKRLGDNVVTIFIKKIALKGLSPADLIDKKNIDLGSLVIDSPEIKLVHKKRDRVDKDSASFSEKITRDQQQYSIGELLLNDIRLTVTNLDKQGQVSSFKNLSASFKDIKIDSAAGRDSSRFLYAKDAMLFMKGYHATTKNNLYNFTIDSVALKPQDGTMNFFHLALKPIGTKDQFSAKLQFMTDRFDIHVNRGSTKNINWFNLLAGEGFFADAMTLSGGYVHVYDDRRLPTTQSKVGKFPHQLLMKVELPLNIPKVKLDGFEISYEEFNPKANKTGKVEFNEVSGIVENVTNIPSQIAANPVAKVTAAARLMNEGLLNVTFRFELDKANTGAFELDATLGKMNGEKMNTTTEGLALLRIKSCSIDQLKAHLKGSNYSASGKVKFLYHDLSVDILKADEDGDTKKRGLLSLIAKTFVIKKSNPSKEGYDAPEYEVTYIRDVHKSFFNLVWKLIMEGIKKSVKK